MNNEVKTLIEKLKLFPHPEGGYYAEIHRSQLEIAVPEEIFKGGSRTACTSIYYLLTGESFSAWHRICSDEIWSYHYGHALTVLIIDKNGVLSHHKVGNPLLDAENCFQVVVPAHSWFCAFLTAKNSFSLAACFVAPGFEFTDFELANPQKLSQLYPDHQALIEKYSR